MTAARGKNLLNDQTKHAYLNDRLKPLLAQHNFFESKSNVKVLSIGCGSSPIELLALNDLAQEYKVELTYTGLDVERDAIETCKENYPIENAAFHAIDCCDLNKIKQAIGHSSVDVIIARHPVFWATNPVSKYFRYIFTSVIPNLLLETGTLILSFYHPEEKDDCIKLMKHITPTYPQELPESTQIEWLTEYQSTYLKDNIPSTCYADRYFISYLNFTFLPTVKIEMDEKLSLTSLEVNAKKELSEMLFIVIENKVLNNDFPANKMMEILHNLVDNAVTGNTLLDNIDSSPNILPDRENLFQISWHLVRAGIVNKKFDSSAKKKVLDRLESIISLLLRLKKMNFNSNEEFQLACYQGLKLLAARPLLRDIFPATAANEEAITPLNNGTIPFRDLF